MKTQATRMNRAQLEHEILRQRAGLPCAFANKHPILDGLLGSALLVGCLFGITTIWISVL